MADSSILHLFFDALRISAFFSEDRDEATTQSRTRQVQGPDWGCDEVGGRDFSGELGSQEMVLLGLVLEGLSMAQLWIVFDLHLHGWAPFWFKRWRNTSTGNWESEGAAAFGQPTRLHTEVDHREIERWVTSLKDHVVALGGVMEKWSQHSESQRSRNLDGVCGIYVVWKSSAHAAKMLGTTWTHGSSADWNEPPIVVAIAELETLFGTCRQYHVPDPKHRTSLVGRLWYLVPFSIHTPLPNKTHVGHRSYWGPKKLPETGNVCHFLDSEFRAKECEISSTQIREMFRTAWKMGRFLPQRTSMKLAKHTYTHMKHGI